MKKIFLLLCAVLPLFASELRLKEGFVAAHTEMLLDRKIDPLNSVLRGEISMQGDELSSLKGTFTVEMGFFKSDNSDRDKEMDEALEITKFPLATYTIEDVVKTESENNYILKGRLAFHGEENELSFNAEIIQDDKSVTISAISKMWVSEYGVEMPCLLFMCVRDQVDLFAKAVLIK